MRLFFDNDLVSKLAHLDLLDVGVESLGSTMAEVRVLPTARYKLLVHKPAKGIERHGPEVHARLTRFLGQVAACQDAPDPQDAVLGSVLDAGEAILVSHASRVPDSLMATGDKRAIRSLAAAPQCAAITRRLRGRVLCLEQVLLRIVDGIGFETVRDRVVATGRIDFDTVVRSAFGSGARSEERNACGSLERRVRELMRDDGSLLAPTEFRFDAE